MWQCTHFVGFRGNEYHTACKVFGLPDFIHRLNDLRLWQMVQPQDVVVFANGYEAKTPHPQHSFNDSQYI